MENPCRLSSGIASPPAMRVGKGPGDGRSNTSVMSAFGHKDGEGFQRVSPSATVSECARGLGGQRSCPGADAPCRARGPGRPALVLTVRVTPPAPLPKAGGEFCCLCLAGGWARESSCVPHAPSIPGCAVGPFPRPPPAWRTAGCPRQTPVGDGASPPPDLQKGGLQVGVTPGFIIETYACSLSPFPAGAPESPEFPK